MAEQVDFGNLARRFLVVILQAVQSKRNLVTMIVYSVSHLPILLNRHTSMPTALLSFIPGITILCLSCQFCGIDIPLFQPPCCLLFLGLLFCVFPASFVE